MRQCVCPAIPAPSYPPPGDAHVDILATSHLSDDALLLDARQVAGRRSRDTAILLTRIAEIDQRQLYRRAGYSSLYAYLLGELHMLEDSACRHIHASRLARRFPALLIAMFEHRLHMRAVMMLAPHLTPGNADELVAAASHKTRFEIRVLLAERFPQPDRPERLQPIAPFPAPSPGAPQPVPGMSGVSAPERIRVTNAEQPVFAPIETNVPDPPRQTASARVESPVPAQRVTPLAPQRYAYECTFDQETLDLMQRARDLMGHLGPPPDGPSVLKSALRLLVGQLEKQKYAATDRPLPSKPGTSARHIPAAVKRSVRKRDGERCAFVSESGHRCSARDRLEFDHIEPVARGGSSTVENVRLVCRAHNQHAAECALGIEFMERKRAEARRDRPRPSRPSSERHET